MDMAGNRYQGMNVGNWSGGRQVPVVPVQMSAQDVQSVVQQQTDRDSQNAAQAAALNLEPGTNITGMGQNGTGNWYRLVGAGGKVGPESAAAFLGANPGGYSSPYAPAMQNLMNQLLNPEQFRYDVNADGLYQQIKDSYIKNGRQAMMDTQGQSAAMTGGYGNSYGAMAGQQAYQESLGSLAGTIPELQQLAYQQYLNNEDAKRNNLEALNKLDAQEYARWQDDMAAYMEMLKNVQAGEVMAGGGGYNPGVVGGPMERNGANIFTMGPGTADQYQIDPVKHAQLMQAYKDGIISEGMIRTGAVTDNYIKGYDKRDFQGVMDANGLVNQPNTYNKGNRGSGYDTLPSTYSTNVNRNTRTSYDPEKQKRDMGY